MGKLQIDLLGTSFSVQAKEDDAYLNKLLSYYKNIVNTIQHSVNIKDNVQVSILAGITLVDELYKEKQKGYSYTKDVDSTDDEVEKITNDMISKIDEVL